MRSISRLAAALLIASVMLVAGSGCGNAPTGPVTTNSVGSSSSVAASPGSAGQASGLISTLGGVVGGLVNLVVRTLNLVGSLGGSLTNGRWRVDVPAGAVDGNATISISVVNNQSSECQLDIQPSDKNHFSTPVTLTIDCSSIPSDRLAGYAMFWFNPATNNWEQVAGSTVNLNHKTVSAPLHHFSRYDVQPADGKAGW